MFGFGTVSIEGSTPGNALQAMMGAPDIEPGDPPSYELCKTLWLWHPLGKKIVEGPIKMAQSQKRKISIPKSPEERVRDKFVEQWTKDRCNKVIYGFASVARAYGIATLAVDAKGVPRNQPIKPDKWHELEIVYHTFDPLNTAGSMVLNQDPGSIDFMKVTGVAVAGQEFHRSRTVVLMNEQPVYIAWSTSAYGFVGRSVFQRALFPLKSFLQTMITDDLVAKKAGVFVVMLSSAGAIINQAMQNFAGLKRLFVKQSTNGNVISLGKDEKIETMDMTNVAQAMGQARTDILENIATGVDMPAIILKQETFAEGFGEGTEDSKLVAGFINSYREDIEPAYAFLEPITMRRAWTPEFYSAVQNEFPEYSDVTFDAAFYQWQNSFKSEWPNYLQEPDSEKVKTDDVKLKAALAAVEVLAPELDPENKARLIEWFSDTINENKVMFQNPLILDIDALMAYEPPDPMALEPDMPKPFAAADSAGERPGRKARIDRAVANLTTAVNDLVAAKKNREGRRLRKPNGSANSHPA